MKVKKILISQPKPEDGKSPYLELEEKHKVSVTFRPFIKIEPILSKEFRTQKVNLTEHTAVIFTTRLGIENYFRLMQELRVPVSDSTKYYCISATVANYLQHFINFRKRKVFGANGLFSDLISLVTKHKEEKFLVVLPENDNEKMIEMIQQSGIDHKIAIMYRTVSNDFTPEEKFDYDMLLFFSPNGIHALKKNFPDFEQGDIVIGCLGDTTAKAIEAAGLRLDIKVPSPKYSSLTVAVDDFIKENHKRR